MYEFINHKITTATVVTIFKAGLIGLLSAESCYFGVIIAGRVNELAARTGNEHWALVLSVIGLFITTIYLFSRGFFIILFRIVESKRFDLFIAFGLGILADGLFGGIGTSLYSRLMLLISDRQILVLITLPLISGLLILLRAIQTWWVETNKEKAIPFFISDVEQKYKETDLLQFSESAERFAERVFNRGSLDSVVFGIDAPWGIGKSTFVNFCEEYWRNNYREDVILYKFNPLRYEGRANLLEKFIDGLVRVIQDKSFAPEIRPLISSYSRFIKSTKTTFMFPWLNFEVFWGAYTIDDAFNDLESTLSNLNKKIIVVVDDLDRMNFSTIKDILFVIKKSFTLPNISYVLCYDTENITALDDKEHDTEKITEFLEKFVNVKISLFLDNKVLSEYISKNLDKALESNLQIDPLTKETIRQVMSGIVDVYNSRDFHEYIPFLGDVRKLKRIINALLLFEIDKTDFENSDFNKQDLIHLLLIYMNYPDIFRKIYNTETNGKRGFFSVVMPYEDNYPKENGKKHIFARNNTYQNSTDYTNYINSLTPKQKFLLNKIFNVSQRLENAAIDSVAQEIKHSYACFNGLWGDGRNLEEYLNLIVKLSKPQKTNQYRFYLNCKNELLKGKAIENVLSEHEEFSYSRSESTHEQLWRVIINSLHEFDSQTGAKLITYLLHNIQNYSLLTYKDIGIGLRDDIDFFLIKALDTVGWSDENGRHRNNTEKNIAEIAEWVFGEGKHKGAGVIETLAQEKRGVLGLYDVLVFRLFCSADRGGDIFNLSRALSKHGDPEAPTEGSTKVIAVEEMREISQKVFQIFESQYIGKHKNIFELIDNLSLADLTGKYQSFVEGKIAAGVVQDVDAVIGTWKSRIIAFTTYQLANSLVSSGVGCGYYDPSGKEDKHEIKTKINDYLFTECFNPEKNTKNYEYFVDYLLISFARVFASEYGEDYIPHIKEFTKVLDPEKLAEYWKNNSQNIEALNLHERDRVVFQGNYSASYKEDLPKVYEELDKLVKKIE